MTLHLVQLGKRDVVAACNPTDLVASPTRYAMRIRLLLVVFLLPLVARAQSTEQVSKKYLEMDAALNYEGLRPLLADDFSFGDPTGEVFRADGSAMSVAGAEAFLELQKSWGLAEVDFDPDVSFAVGEYALHRGTYRARFDGADSWTEIPFVTIHRVSEGKMIERLDFGEYIQSFGLGDGFDDNTSWTEVIADQYLAAYTGGDIATQNVLMADDVVFQDPTAQVFGPPSGRLFEGKEALLTRRTQIYQNVTDFSFDASSRFYANHHAVYIGHVEYAAGGRWYRQPSVFVIEVRDQLVRRHWDFVDYSVGAVE